MEREIPHTDLDYQEQEPFLVIEANRTQLDVKRMMRYVGVSGLIVTSLWYTLILFALIVILNLIDGETVAEAAHLDVPAIIIWLCFILYYAFMHLISYPNRLMKNRREQYGDDASWTTLYQFYENMIVYKTYGSKGSTEDTSRYTDIRKIRDYKHAIMLQTKIRNKTWIGKAGITVEDQKKMLDAFRERCKL